MIYEVFSVYDSKAEAFLPPFILPRIAQAKRAFSDCINSADHQFGQHPQDYTLFRLGCFNDEDGQFLLERTKQSLGNGVEFILNTDEPTAKEGTNGQAYPSVQQIADESSLRERSASDDTPE